MPQSGFVDSPEWGVFRIPSTYFANLWRSCVYRVTVRFAHERNFGWCGNDRVKPEMRRRGCIGSDTLLVAAAIA
jgi:hypothetical protein